MIFFFILSFIFRMDYRRIHGCRMVFKEEKKTRFNYDIDDVMEVFRDYV